MGAIDGRFTRYHRTLAPLDDRTPELSSVAPALAANHADGAGLPV